MNLIDQNFSQQQLSASSEIFKVMMISGVSLDVILSDELLTSHLKLMIRFCKNILGYGLSPSHKVVLVSLL